jgi:hypothetical protein
LSSVTITVIASPSIPPVLIDDGVTRTDEFALDLEAGLGDEKLVKVFCNGENGFMFLFCVFVSPAKPKNNFTQHDR